MKDLFYMGGPLFMGVLSLVLISMVAWAVYHVLPVLTGSPVNLVAKRKKLKHIKTIGAFGLVTGILGQLVGLYAAFEAIEQAGDIAPGILAGGLKVSMITTIYGVLIFLISLLLWLLLDFIISKKAE
jgi:hypothetical protein